MRQASYTYGRLLRYAALSLPLLFLVLFFFYPLSAILVRSFRVSDRPVLPNVGYLARVLWFTVWQATASTLLTLLLGLPGAHVFARYRFPGKSLLQALTTVPFVLPTLIVATAFSSLIGPNGLVNTALMRVFRVNTPPLDLQHTIWIVLLAHVFYNYSVVLRVVGSFWSNLNPRLEEAARTLGASRWQAWWEVTLPQLAPAIAAAALLTFLFCFTSFGVVLILGGPRLATVEVEIYRQAVHLLNLPLAAALSLVQLLLTFATMSVYTALQRRTARPLDYRSRQAAQLKPDTWRARVWIVVHVALMVTLLIAPLLSLVWRSLTLGGPFTLRYYRALWQDPGRSLFFTPPPTAIRNSLLFALAAVALSLALGTLGAYLLASRDAWLRRVIAWLDPLLALPLGASAVTLGFGYLIAFGQPPLNWVSSPILVPVVHALIAFPFVLRSSLPALRGIRPSIREAAAMLGSAPGRVWWAVDLPLIARPLAVGAVFAFTISIGEFGATLLIARTEYATIPVTLYRYLSQPGQINIGQALAMSVLLMGICTISFLLIERFRVGDIGSF
jgi:thiamine transport system permease protein